jgi:hypothetical protein
MNEVVVKEKAPLDELMLAMDVVSGAERTDDSQDRPR